MTLAELDNKRIGVLGFGQEGQALIAYLQRHGHNPVLFDKRQLNEFSAAQQEQIKQMQLVNFLGPSYLDHLAEIDVIFRSPGLWRLTPQLVQAEQRGAVITSQVQWFFEHCPAPIIGVTGTKGKGTTASLLAHFLKRDGRKVFLTGNIGQIQPVEILDDLTAQDLIIYELSSFQLQNLLISPHIAVVLMVTEDHLDIHASLAEYHEAKAAITKYQTSQDLAIINDDYLASKTIGNLSKGQKLYFSRQHAVTNGAFVEKDNLAVMQNGEQSSRLDLTVSSLKGEHNRENIAAAVVTATFLGVSAESLASSLPTFRALPHRLQRLPDQEGVQFYDDSISTVPDTAVAAIDSFEEPLILILGGSKRLSRGDSFGKEPVVDFSRLAGEVATKSNIKAVAVVGERALEIKTALEQAGFRKLILAGFKTMKETLAGIKAVAETGDVVLLSPACKSFDWYENYKQRGEDFQRLVSKWGEL